MNNTSAAIADRLQQHPEVITRGLARGLEKAGNAQEVTIPITSPEIEKLLQDAFNDAAQTTKIVDQVLADIKTSLPVEQQLDTMANAVQNDTEQSLNAATPAGASEIGAALAPHLAHPAAPTTATSAVENQPSPGTSAAPSVMPAEGVGEDIAPNNQPTAGPASETPGTPDAENPATPSGLSQPTPAGATPSIPKAVSPESANLGSGAPGFEYSGSPEQRQAGMETYAQQAQAQQLAEPNRNGDIDFNSAEIIQKARQGQQDMRDRAGQQGQQKAAEKAGGTAGSGLPGVSVPQTPDNTANTPTATTPSEQPATQPETPEASRPRQMLNSFRRRTEIKKVDQDIKENEKNMRNVEFKYGTEYFLLVCFKEGVDLLMTALALTGFLAWVGGIFSAVCLASQGLILWWQTQQWRKEVFDNKRALQAIVVYIVELIPILNILPLNIINALALQIQSERRQKKYRARLEKLQKQRHKLVHARRL